MSMELILVVILTFLMFLVSYVSFKGTVLGLSPRRGLVWSPLYYKTLCFIFVPLILVQIFPLDELSNNPPPASPEVINRVTVYSFLSVFFFTMILAFLLRNSRTARYLASFKVDSNDCAIFISFGYVFACLGLLLFFVAVFFLGHQHALIKSILSGENILSVRLSNAYVSNLPSQVAAFFSMAYKVVAIASGVALAVRRRWHSLILILISLFISSIGGAKAPLATAVIFFTLSYVIVNRPTFGFKSVFLYLILYPLAVFSAVYFITSYQIPELNFSSFMSFIFTRLGFGQMAGTFNTFSIPPLHGEYFYHIIPFASIFVDYPIYQKDLMLHVMGVDFERTGIQNSLFISEAYGIGGWSLVLLSPFIVGVSYFFGLMLFYYYIKFAVGERISGFYSVPLYVSSMDLTGGFSSFPLFKATLLMMIILLPVVSVWRVRTIFSKSALR